MDNPSEQSLLEKSFGFITFLLVWGDGSYFGASRQVHKIDLYTFKEVKDDKEKALNEKPSFAITVKQSWLSKALSYFKF